MATTDTTDTTTSPPPVSTTQPASEGAAPKADNMSTPPPVTASNVNSLSTDTNQTPAPPAPVTDAAPANSTGTPTAAGQNPLADAFKNKPAPTGKVAAPAPSPIANPGETSAAKQKSTKAAATAAQPTLLEQQADALAGVNDTIKSMMEGNDPIATREFNSLINSVGPQNQMALEGLGMKLRQENMDGPGAGDALLEMMGRDLQYSTDQLVAKIGADSAKRLYDLNKWGFEKATEIHDKQTQLDKDNFNMAIKLGQYDVAAGLWDKIMPGVPFDANAAKAYDPNQQAIFSARSAMVQQLVDQGDADGAKQAMVDLARTMPEAFGYSNPEDAVNAVSKLDYSKEAYANNVAFNAKVTTDIRDAAAQGDVTSAHNAIDRYYANKAPGAAQAEGRSALGNMSLPDVNKVLKDNNKAEVDANGMATLDPEEFAKDLKYSQELGKAKGANAVDLELNAITDVHPEIGKDPALRDAARAWIFDNMAGFNLNPDGTALAGFTFKPNAGLPPWDPNSVSGHMYSDWPIATFNDDGSLASTTYSGFEPYDDKYQHGDLTTEKGRHNAAVDTNWEAYVADTRKDPSSRLTREDWYFATKGGTQRDPIASQKPKVEPKPGDSVNDISSIGNISSQADYLAWAKNAPEKSTMTMVGGEKREVPVLEIDGHKVAFNGVKQSPHAGIPYVMDMQIDSDGDGKSDMQFDYDPGTGTYIYPVKVKNPDGSVDFHVSGASTLDGAIEGYKNQVYGNK